MCPELVEGRADLDGLRPQQELTLR
jgi:hypothetical protein